MQYGINYTLSNENYHNETDFYSSSMLKLMLQSPEQFYKKYVLKKIDKESNTSAMEVGTAIHMRILEPAKYETDVVFFEGTRRGKAWDAFKSQYEGKLILGDVQKIQIDKMYQSFIKSELGPQMIKGGNAEVSLFTNLQDLNIRTRADYLTSDTIYDVKSQRGIVTEENFRGHAESKLYGYDLQAALYVDAFFNEFRYPFKFAWIVMSKDFDEIKFFEASSEMIEQGRKKYKEAIKLIKKYNKEGWNFKNQIISLKPSSFKDDLEF